MATRTRSDTTDGRRTASAARVIGVTLLSLIVAALLNADSLVGSIEGQTFGTSRSMGLALARPIRTVSHWTGLNLPRKLIDAMVNGDRPKTVGLPVRSTSPSPAAAATTTTTTAPVRRIPTPQQPLKVWLAGDSLMGTIAESFNAAAGGNPLIAVSHDFRIGTGLARPDVYSWPTRVSQEMASVNPDVIVFVFGTNDDQDMVSGGHRFVLQSEDWQAEYARRVNQLLELTANGVRQVIWLGIPAVRRPRLDKTKDLINSAVKTATTEHPGASFVDTGATLDGANGSFTTYLNNSSGKAITIRESDGIHITLAGANLLTPILLADVDRLWALPPH